MTTKELKAKVESYRDDLKAKSGSSCLFSAEGPVGMSLIDAIIATLDAQQTRIQELEQKLG